jgi:hypothetical protein
MHGPGYLSFVDENNSALTIFILASCIYKYRQCRDRDRKSGLRLAEKKVKRMNEKSTRLVKRKDGGGPRGRQPGY